MADLARDYGWTFLIIGTDIIAKCGDCNIIGTFRESAKKEESI